MRTGISNPELTFWPSHRESCRSTRQYVRRVCRGTQCRVLISDLSASPARRVRYFDRDIDDYPLAILSPVCMRLLPLLGYDRYKRSGELRSPRRRSGIAGIRIVCRNWTNWIDVGANWRGLVARAARSGPGRGGAYCFPGVDLATGHWNCWQGTTWWKMATGHAR